MKVNVIDVPPKNEDKLRDFNNIDDTLLYLINDIFNLSKPPVKKEKPKVFPDDVKFSYYGCTDTCNDHDGVIVVVSHVNNEMVEYGVAYCSPKDVYDKHHGKFLAYRDMIEENKMVVLSGKKHHKINARIFADIVANADCPSWANDKVASELTRHLIYGFELEDE